MLQVILKVPVPSGDIITMATGERQPRQQCPSIVENKEGHFFLVKHINNHMHIVE